MREHESPWNGTSLLLRSGGFVIGYATLVTALLVGRGATPVEPVPLAITFLALALVCVPALLLHSILGVVSPVALLATPFILSFTTEHPFAGILVVGILGGGLALTTAGLVEYVVRRATGRCATTLDPALEYQLARGLAVGILYVGFVTVVVSGSAVGTPQSSGLPDVRALLGLCYLFGGVILVGAIPVVLWLRYDLLLPALVILADAFVLVLGLSGGDLRAPGSALFWPVYLVVFALIAVLEMGIREFLPG